MNNASFYRKVVYACLIVALWFPLSFIGEPPSVNVEGERTGGKLTQLRDEYALSQANLGDIDPTSESMKLATLGMRGVALNVLWTMANHYKKVEDFDNFSATVNQITLLAPNFVAVWEFQAHNESYNVSVEYDHYKMRYAWVKKGIDLMIRGTHYNRKDTRLLSYLSWFFGQKIGRSDERKQFRVLFREDHDYHNQLTKSLQMALDDREVLGPNRKEPDNWLVGRKVQLRAVNLVESAGAPIRGKSPVLFYADAPMLRINYAKAIEEEGWLGDIAGDAWRLNLQDWKDYGQQPVPTSWGHNIQLGDYERYQQRADDALKKLTEELAPGVRDEIYQEKLAKLRPDERLVLETPANQRTDQQASQVYELQQRVNVTPDEIANRAPTANRREAKRVAREHVDALEMATRIDRYRSIVNYVYWKTRCEVEQSAEALAARQYISDAEKAYSEGILEAGTTGQDGAKELYEKAWKEWAKVYEKYPSMMDDVDTGNVVDSIENYVRVLTQLEYSGLPADFPLRKMLEVNQRAAGLPPPMAAPTEEKPAEEKPGQEKPAETPSSEEPKAEDKPADTKPTEEPAAEKPADDKPAEEKPEATSPAADAPKANADAPSEEKPADDTPPAETTDKPADE